MRKTFVLLSVFLLSMLPAFSQSFENSMLWKISGNGIENPSYVFGTFHMLCPDQLVISEKLIRSMKECDRLVLELDFDDPNLMASMQTGMMFTDGTSAKDYLNDEEYKLVSGFFAEKMQMPFQMIAGIKPFFLSALTMIYFMDCQPASMEQKLMETAGKEVIGLESVEDQMNFIDNIPLEDQKSMLISGVEDLEEMDEMTSKMVETYLKEDLAGIQSITEEYMTEDYVELNEELIVSRNHDWVPKIDALIREHSCFVAVGAGHLGGEAGLLNLLQKEGYTVEAVN